MHIDFFLVAIVLPHHYEALRALIEGAPTTHEEWVELMKRREIEESRKGFSIRHVNVDPQKFADFCRLRGEETNFVTLSHFLAESDISSRHGRA